MMQKSLRMFFSYVLVLVICLGNVSGVKAADEQECVDGSYLVSDEYSEGSSIALTRGVYLGSGSSTITKEGTGKIGAGGKTIGQTTVATISITVRVEKLVNGSWTTYKTWTTTKYNSAYVSTSKVLSVPTGYYYRVYSTHKANSDISGSYTNGIHI